MDDAANTVLVLSPMSDFVETDEIRDITNRTLSYIQAGFPVHFRGVSGTGKTTLAMHVAAILGRPVVLIHGDEEFSTSDLIGAEQGYRFRKVVDRFVSKVFKLEEEMTKRWMDNRLTVACRHGFTLIYDEFTRSRPEANNILLPILSEKVLDMSPGKRDEPYLRVHPDFTAIFTSNPEEYAGVYRSQDALRDRIITLDLDHFGFETETVITETKGKLPREDSEKVVNIVRGLRESGKCEFAPTVRSCIMLAKTLKVKGFTPSKTNGDFARMCQDILASGTSRVGSKTNQNKVKEVVGDMIEKYC